MALRVAVANGNWSNPAIWNNGVLPVAGDVIASNGFTVTIDQNINVDLLTNTVQSPVKATPNMTSNTTPSGIVASSSQFNASYPPFRAFDNSFAEWLSGGPTGWISYEFTTPTIIGVYTLTAGNSNAPGSRPRNWTFEAWNGTSWIVLDTVSGNSNASVSKTTSNTTAYISYRINITANNGDSSYSNISELLLYEANSSLTPAVAGGGFILDGTYIVTATGQGLVTGATRLLTYTGSNSVINGTILGPQSGGEAIFHNSAGTLTINGNVTNTSNPTTYTIVTNSTGTLNINGNIQGDGRGFSVLVNSACTVNIVGNLTRNSNFSGGATLQIQAAATVNITGILSNTAGGTGSPTVVVSSSLCILNVTGDVIFNGTQSSCHTITISQPGRVTVVGNVYNTGVNAYAILSSTNGYLSIIGSIYTTSALAAVLSNNASAINLFSGPFICSPYGFMPYQVVRMHLIRTIGTYFEFRDETTNGALSPSPFAPATRLVSPDTAVDAPIPADVRDGVSYSLGTFTGTLKVPSPNSVSFGIPIDNTIGTAVLTPSDVWNAQTSAMNTAGSIGKRLKNASTVDSTGDQLTSLL